MDTMEELDIKCPEGYGDARLTFFLKEHVSGGFVDKRIVYKLECDIQDSLLKQSKKCGFSCENTQQYKTFRKRLEL